MILQGLVGVDNPRPIRHVKQRYQARRKALDSDRDPRSNGVGHNAATITQGAGNGEILPQRLLPPLHVTDRLGRQPGIKLRRSGRQAYPVEEVRCWKKGVVPVEEDQRLGRICILVRRGGVGSLPVPRCARHVGAASGAGLPRQADPWAILALFLLIILLAAAESDEVDSRVHNWKAGFLHGSLSSWQGPATLDSTHPSHLRRKP
mmetsp:Transcript_23331/g.51541  ORF Transcript_23331/g.51541 Transcript_23331/m.51541 type:complete len:205 (+) Transcript_23331:742-1356(+)